jgi:hypothetical protein
MGVLRRCCAVVVLRREMHVCSSSLTQALCEMHVCSSSLTQALCAGHPLPNLPAAEQPSLDIPHHDTPTVVERLWYWYASALMHPFAKASVIIGALGWLAYCIYALINIKTGFHVTDVLPRKLPPLNSSPPAFPPDAFPLVFH